MGITLTYMGTLSATTGMLVQPSFNVVLASPIPSWPAGIDRDTVMLALAWSDDPGTDENRITENGATILSLSQHISEILTVEPITMPSGNFSKTVAVFRPATIAEENQGKYWVKTNITYQVSITNSGTGTDDTGSNVNDTTGGGSIVITPAEDSTIIDDSEDSGTLETGTGTSKWLKIGLAIGAVIIAGGLGMYFLRRKK